MRIKQTESPEQFLERQARAIAVSQKVASGVQLTDADVVNSEPGDILAAVERGQLASLGIGRSRRRSR